jgi:hypothetical protein
MLRAAPAVVVALTGWISLNPYFFWGTSTPLLVASVAVALSGGLLLYQGRRLHLDLEWTGVALLSIFLVYITVLPRVDGGHVRWVFVLPTLWTLALMDGAERRRCLDIFCTVFAASLVPGIVIAVAAFLGLPLTFVGPEPVATRANLSLIHLPGALFILESNHLLMPWGGVLFRMSAACSPSRSPSSCWASSASASRGRSKRPPSYGRCR